MAAGWGPPFHADHVGSLLRPQPLKDAFRDVHSGRIDQNAFRTIQDGCIRDAVAMQEEVGLQSITDGEFRRGSWFLGFVEAVEGLGVTDAPFEFHDGAGGTARFQTACVEGKLRRVRGITTDEFVFVKSLTRRTPKVTLPTPSLVHFLGGDKTVNRTVYPDMDEFWADLIAVYCEELRALAGLGCRYVQLDEVPIAMLCDPDLCRRLKAGGTDPEELLKTYIWAVNQVATQRPDGMTIALHLCRGNYKGRWMAVGGYDPVAERLFGEAAVDAFFLEYDSDRAGGFEPLRFVPASRKVVLGIVSSKTPQLESIDLLKRRIDAASRYVTLDRLGISPQCGFASSVGGNPLTIEEERAKLRRVVEVAEQIWN
jgi:5-methyltetrahydropteroyltriglutamate--homocysteine methyltransferase